MSHTPFLDTLADHPEAGSILTTGCQCLQHGLRLSRAAHNHTLPEQRAEHYERAQHEFAFAAWAARELAHLLRAAGQDTDAGRMSSQARGCARWARDARWAHERAAQQPIGRVPT